MKQSPTLIKLLLSLIGLLGVTTANAQVDALNDLATGTLGVYCSADQVKLTASAGGTTYIWKRYEGAGTTGTMVTLAGTAINLVDIPPIAKPGYYTYVSVAVNSEGCESPASDPAVIYALPAINAAIASNNPITKFCTNALPASLTLTATGSEAVTVTEDFAYTYQWYKGAAAISGATNKTYTLNSTDDTAVGTGIAYTVKINYVIKSCTEATSTAISFDVIALPSKPSISITL